MTKRHPIPYSTPKGTYRLLPTSIDSGLLVAVLLALFAVVPLLGHPGLPNTADGPVHLMRQVELNQAWRDSIFYPRWAPDLAYGYGMPLFNYAPPLLYHVTQVIHLTGLALDASMVGTLVLILLLYSVGAYLFGRDVFSPRAGLLAAAVYLYAPYRLREAYIQGNYGQFLGLAFYPLILWSFHGLVTTNRRRYLPLAAVSLAGLLLSHNISTMIFMPLFVAYLVFLLVLRRLENREISKLADWEIEKSEGQEGRSRDSVTPNSPIPLVLFALVLGLGLSAFFWLPAFGERDLMRLAGITRGFFDFRYNFISLAELLALPRPLDLSAINPYFPLGLGVAQIVFSGLALFGLVTFGVLRATDWWRDRAQNSELGNQNLEIRNQTLGFGTRDLGIGAGRHRLHALGHAVFFAVALLLTAFLTLPASRLIWEVAPFLELTEFPWRWLGPAVLCSAMLAGAAMYMVEELASARHWPPAVSNWALVAGLLFTVAVNLFYLFPAQFILWGTPTPADALAYEAQSGAIGTTSTGEFLPRWADRYPSPDVLGPDYAAGRLPTKLDPVSLPEETTAATLTHTARETQVVVSSPVPFLATFRALYWPNWRVFVTEGAGEDGREISDVEITQPEGLIRVPLPAGEYRVTLRLFSTPVRQAATGISVVSVVIFFGLVLSQLVGWKAGRLEGGIAPDSRSFQSSSLPVIQAMVIGAAILIGLLVTRPMAGWFRVRSPLDVAYGAEHTLRADFGDQVRLLAYDLPTSGGLAHRAPSKIGWPGDDEKPRQPSNHSPKGTYGPIFQPSNLPTIQAHAGETLPVVLYWRALTDLSADYSVFAHLDGPNGQTFAGADELNPEDIPTSHWPPSLYVRNPLTLAMDTDLPPIRYTLTVGLYDPESGARLPVAGNEDARDALPLAYVWLSPPTPPVEGDIPHRLDYMLGKEIALLGYDWNAAEEDEITLYWRADAPVEHGYTVFIHALGAGGEVVAQFDAPPLNGLYPTDAWLPGQVIADTHSIAWPESAQSLAIGLYDPISPTRLSMIDGGGRRVPDDAVILQLTGNR